MWRWCSDGVDGPVPFTADGADRVDSATDATDPTDPEPALCALLGMLELKDMWRVVHPHSPLTSAMLSSETPRSRPRRRLLAFPTHGRLSAEEVHPPRPR